MMKTVLFFACAIALAASTNVSSIVSSITNIGDNIIDGIDGVNQQAVTTGSDAAISLIKMGNETFDAAVDAAQQGLENLALTSVAAIDGVNNTVHAIANSLSSVPLVGDIVNVGAQLNDMGLQLSETALLTGGSALLKAMDTKKTLASLASQLAQTKVNLVGTGLKDGSTTAATVGKGMNSFINNAFKLFG